MRQRNMDDILEPRLVTASDSGKTDKGVRYLRPGLTRIFGTLLLRRESRQ